MNFSKFGGAIWYISKNGGEVHPCTPVNTPIEQGLRQKGAVGVSVPIDFQESLYGIHEF